MANSEALADVHSLSVVRDRTYDITSTGRETTKETWVKAVIKGAEGSVEEKFALLFASRLQFKISTTDRVNDAKAGDTYYPRGKETAQLFSILSNMVGVVDMDEFDAAKWEKRFLKCLASRRLTKYISSQLPPVVPLVETPVDNNRMQADPIPVVALTTKTNGKIKSKV